MRVGTFVLAVAVLASCDRSATPRGNAAVPPANGATGSVRTAANPSPADSADDCGLLHAQRFTDPLELARYYVEHDSMGVFLESTPVMDSVYLCPQHLPGPDTFTLVKGTQLRLLARTDTTADIEFAGVTAGTIQPDSTYHMYLDSKPAAIADTFHLVKTPFGWRIDSPQLPDWVSGTFVLRQAGTWKLSPGVVDSVKAFVSRPGV